MATIPELQNAWRHANAAANQARRHVWEVANQGNPPEDIDAAADDAALSDGAEAVARQNLDNALRDKHA